VQRDIASSLLDKRALAVKAACLADITGCEGIVLLPFFKTIYHTI
jgi:hypothetical protein